jgi:hypothetical protein
MCLILFHYSLYKKADHECFVYFIAYTPFQRMFEVKDINCSEVFFFVLFCFEEFDKVRFEMEILIEAIYRIVFTLGYILELHYNLSCIVTFLFLDSHNRGSAVEKLGRSYFGHPCRF